MIFKNFTIYAERDCGTKYTEKLITSVFDLPVTWGYGNKHFFGRYDTRIKNSRDTLFICMTRNPYDWVMALFKHKHHLPFDVGNDINLYLHGEWRSVDYRGRGWYDNPVAPDSPREIVADRDWENNKRYKNIFKMRSKKMQYIYDMRNLTPNHIFFRFEDLVKNPAHCLLRLSHKFNLPVLSVNYPPPHQKKPYPVADNVKKIIDSNVDWAVEKLFNYFPQQRRY